MAYPLSGAELKQYMTVGTRVIKGRDWDWGEDDREYAKKGDAVPYKGTVCEGLGENGPGWVTVKWDKGETYHYRMGAEGKYDLGLAPIEYEKIRARKAEEKKTEHEENVITRQSRRQREERDRRDKAKEEQKAKQEESRKMQVILAKTDQILGNRIIRPTEIENQIFELNSILEKARTHQAEIIELESKPSYLKRSLLEKAKKTIEELRELMNEDDPKLAESKKKLKETVAEVTFKRGELKACARKIQVQRGEAKSSGSDAEGNSHEKNSLGVFETEKIIQELTVKKKLLEAQVQAKEENAEKMKKMVQDNEMKKIRIQKEIKKLQKTVADHESLVKKIELVKKTDGYCDEESICDIKSDLQKLRERLVSTEGTASADVTAPHLSRGVPKITAPLREWHDKLKTESQKLKCGTDAPKAPPVGAAPLDAPAPFPKSTKAQEEWHDELACCVCLEIPGTAHVFTCSQDHVICCNCDGKLMKEKPYQCPICRENLTATPLSRNHGFERIIRKMRGISLHTNLKCDTYY